MSPDEISEAMEKGGARVRLFTAFDKTQTVGEGVLVSYSIVPVVAIQLDDGSIMTWRHDLAELVDGVPREVPTEQIT